MVYGRRELAEPINRPRPPRHLWRAHWFGPSFPSRHTTLATVGAALVAGTLTSQNTREAVCAVAGAVG